MPAKIHLERMMYRDRLAIKGESAATYALVKLIPSAPDGGHAIPLNLALVLDVSGSMYEEDGTGISRLRRIQDAARVALGKLRPNDSLAVVAFANGAACVLAPTAVGAGAAIDETIQRIDSF